jgi:hypothetical protein
MWICDDVERQGGQWKQREMMTLPVPSRVSHLYENRNRDVVTFLEIGVDIYISPIYRSMLSVSSPRAVFGPPSSFLIPHSLTMVQSPRSIIFVQKYILMA